jgi:hypothetical protein
VGVSILAILDFIGAGLMALCGATFLIGIGGFAHAPRFASLGTAGGVACLLLAALPALVGWGLWKLQNWARALTMAFAALGILGALFGFLSPDLRLAALLPLLMNGIVAAYLMRTEVRAAFAGGPRTDCELGTCSR